MSGVSGCVTLWLLWITALLSMTVLAEEWEPTFTRLPNEQVCPGTNLKLTRKSSDDEHYRSLRKQFENCTFINGNLEITFIEDPSRDLSFLQHIREVTGYVLIAFVYTERIPLHNLQVIRGQSLYGHPDQGDEEEKYSLYVALNYDKANFNNKHEVGLKSIGFEKLGEILTGDVSFIDNPYLCYIDTIEWKDIVAGSVTMINNSVHQSCPACHPDCELRCWGPERNDCQTLTKTTCAEQCSRGRCFGPDPHDCCHQSCAAGCRGPLDTDCFACKMFNNSGTCVDKCPSLEIYDLSEFQLKDNPDGKYTFGSTCVNECPSHLLKQKSHGACVRQCSEGYRADDNNFCVACVGPCPKACDGGTVNSMNIASFEGCTIIKGNINILDSAFVEYTEFIQNASYPAGTMIVTVPPLHPRQLLAFQAVREITGYLNIQGSHVDLRNLSAFSNLEYIKGRELYGDKIALNIQTIEHLESLDLKKLRSVQNGGIFINGNTKLCYVGTVNFSLLIGDTSKQELSIKNNKPTAQCMLDGRMCHPECSSDGCWGSEDDACLKCAHYKLEPEGLCMHSCDVRTGLYNSSETICSYCHPECSGTCSGPGADKCEQCKNVKDGPYCLDECPLVKYLNSTSGVCMPCADCKLGCTGPETWLGEGGCNACHLAIETTGRETEWECLPRAMSHSCPAGTYYTLVRYDRHLLLQDDNTEMTACRKCHPMCESCDGPGQICTCKYYRDEATGLCESSCPEMTYLRNDSNVCSLCSFECDRACRGPTSLDCFSCRNMKVYLDEEESQEEEAKDRAFNCTAECPPDRPYETRRPEEGNVCSARRSTGPSVPIIVGSVLGIILVIGIILVCFVYQCRKKAQSEEATMKMTIRMTGIDDSVPLTPTNATPNMSRLQIIKEADLRKGGILGYGAFGTVYQGVWIPERDTVKIPVAIKVLREGTSADSNKEMIEEAQVMASVEHPNLVRLLGICLAAQMTLVTPLIPLGCLLVYVRSNKDKIGSRPLLNWCMQIAKGMQYLEERRLVHRDLAARNVLVQSPGLVKITDFGLAKLLDINEDEYKAAGGKMPIKWMALECIQHRIFTHKSDVWSYGVAIWELFTYGERPYESVSARDVPDLLEKGERLPQPNICTIDIYMIMIKCWMLDSESRPSFKELGADFAKMARDPARYLVVQGDDLMRLPSFTPQDNHEFMRGLSVMEDGATGSGQRRLVDAEEYLQPTPAAAIAAATMPPEQQSPPAASPPTSPEHEPFESPSKKKLLATYEEEAEGEDPHRRAREKKYAHLEKRSPRPREREDSIAGRYSSDPLEARLGEADIAEEPSTSAGHKLPNSIAMKYGGGGGHPHLRLQVDEDDYLLPNPPDQPPRSNMADAYLDLMNPEDSPIDYADVTPAVKNAKERPQFKPVPVAVENPEYMDSATNQEEAERLRATGGSTSSEASAADHAYYNDFDSMQKRDRRLIKPLTKNETSV